MTVRQQIIVLTALFIGLFATVAAAQDEASPAAEKEPVGVNIDMTIASIYNFRGLNSFQETSQQDSNAAFFPSITYSVGDSGLYFGYWGAYQLSGNNQREMVRTALGHEQDLYIGWDKSFAGDKATFSAAFTYFFYPFASEEATGSKNPSIIEPLVGVSYAGGLDMGLNLSYFAGIGDATSSLSHLYINPSIAKSLSFNDWVGMDLGLGLGFKVFTDEETRDAGENTVDIVFDAGFPVSIPGGMYVTPTISAAWTNLENNAAGQKATVGDEFMVYGSLSVGGDF